MLTKVKDIKRSWHFSSFQVSMFLVKFICYMFLVVFCIITYLEPQIRKFLKKDKTFATTITEIEQVEMPAMVICANPEFKTSARWNYDHRYGSMQDILMDKEEAYKNIYGKNMWKAYEELTFDFEEDFVFKHVIDIDGQKHFIILKHGMNQNLDYSMNMSKIATFKHGMCCLIESFYKISEKHEFQIMVKRDLEEIGDIPDSLEIFFVSMNMWHGIVDDDWIHVAPSQFEISFELEKHRPRQNFRTSQLVEMTFMEGYDNIRRCQEKMIQESNCFPKCFPLLLNYLDVPPCKNYHEATCMINQTLDARCIQPKSTLQYRMERYDYGYSDFGTSHVPTWSLSFPLTVMEVKEEILIISPEDMIGYTGGALGLFIGFSCFEYFTRLFDKLLTKCRRKNQTLILNEKVLKV